jgi:hypothetical protein
MKSTLDADLVSTSHPLTDLGLRPLLAESMRRSRALTVFGLLMWAAMLPTLLAWGIDDRELRGISVWAKPLKFMASIGLLALSTAWFIGLLPDDRRRGGAIHTVTWTIVLAGGFEITYITLMAALGQASHFNFSSPLHITMYSLMGAGAMAMTATQPLLAWQIARHARNDLPSAWRDGVVVGLVLTFVLGAGAGGLLGSMQPPAGSGLPGVGWHPSGDLRPAHFLGMHAQQLFPLAGVLIATWMPGTGRRALALFTMVYVALWAWAMARGLDGAVLTVPYLPPA